jgi:hypothetical protein
MVALTATLAVYDAKDGNQYGQAEQFDSALWRSGARFFGCGVCGWTDAATAALLGIDTKA